MVKWALAFLVMAIVAAALGFGVVTGAAATAAQVLFFMFLVIFLLLLVFGERVFSREQR